MQKRLRTRFHLFKLSELLMSLRKISWKFNHSSSRENSSIFMFSNVGCTISFLAKSCHFVTYPPPIIRLLSSPAINKSVVPTPSFCNPVHANLTGLGLSLNTKLSPVPKYARVLWPVFLSSQLVVTKPPKICWVINAMSL